MFNNQEDRFKTMASFIKPFNREETIEAIKHLLRIYASSKGLSPDRFEQVYVMAKQEQSMKNTLDLIDCVMGD